MSRLNQILLSWTIWFGTWCCANARIYADTILVSNGKVNILIIYFSLLNGDSGFFP